MHFGINLSTSYILDKPFESIISSLQDLGVEWIRLEFNWYQEEDVQDLVAEFQKHNIKILGLLTGLVPGTIQSILFDKQKYPNPLDRMTSYLSFVERIIKKYPHITHWEIWNEPNLYRFWRRKPDAQEFLELTKKTSILIKKIQPKSKIVMGSLCGTNRKGIGGSQTQFITKIPEISSYVDIYGIHPYTMHSYIPLFLSVKKLIQEVTSRVLEFKKEFPEKEVWVTEYGISTKYFMFNKKKIKQVYAQLVSFSKKNKIPFFLWHLLDTNHHRYSILNPETKFGIFDKKLQLKKFFR